jgi:protein-disulfide isomerase
MIRKTLLIAAAGAALLAPAAIAATDRAEVEKIVREYLLANPEILYEMSAELEKRETQAKADQAAELLKEGSEARKQIFEDGYSFVAGNPQGDVTIVEFFDYRCGFCKKARPELIKLIEQDKNVRVILKEFPILGAASMAASKAAMAGLALDRSKYWNFHMAMLAEDGLTPDRVWELAGEAGYDIEALKKAAEDPVVKERIEANRNLGSDLGVDGTPAFLIGDELNAGMLTFEEIEAKVKAIRDNRGG